MGHPSQAVCCRGRGEGTRGAGAPRLRGDRGVQRRGLTSWSSLALIAPVAGFLLRDRRSRLLKESASSGPKAGASSSRALSCERHTLRTATKVTRPPRPSRSAKPRIRGRGLRAGAAAGGARLCLGRDSGAVTTEAPPPSPPRFFYWFLVSPPPTPAPLGNGASFLRFVE